MKNKNEIDVLIDSIPKRILASPFDFAFIEGTLGSIGFYSECSIGEFDLYMDVIVTHKESGIVKGFAVSVMQSNEVAMNLISDTFDRAGLFNKTELHSFEIEAGHHGSNKTQSPEMQLCGDLSKAADFVSRLGCVGKVNGQSVQSIMVIACGRIVHLYKELSLLKQNHAKLDNENAKMRADAIAKDNRIKDLESQLFGKMSNEQTEKSK